MTNNGHNTFLVSLTLKCLYRLPLLSLSSCPSLSPFLGDLISLPPPVYCLSPSLAHTCKYFLGMTRQNDKSSQIKATLLSPLFSLSLVSPPPLLSMCFPLSPRLTQTGAFPSTTGRGGVFFSFSLGHVCACVYRKRTAPPPVNPPSSLLFHSPASTDGHCYHVQQMS